MNTENLAIPLGADTAADIEGVYCGHGALAAAADCPVIVTLDVLPPGWVNIPRMINALRQSRINPRTVEGWHNPKDPDFYADRAVCLIQWLGPWMDPKRPPKARCQYRHWIAIRRGLVFDINDPRWMTREEWTFSVVPHLYPKRCTGFEAFRSLVWQS